MENKAIDIEPKAATEMQSWTNIYDRVPYENLHSSCNCHG